MNDTIPATELKYAANYIGHIIICNTVYFKNFIQPTRFTTSELLDYYPVHSLVRFILNNKLQAFSKRFILIKYEKGINWSIELILTIVITRVFSK